MYQDLTHPHKSLSLSKSSFRNSSSIKHKSSTSNSHTSTRKSIKKPNTINTNNIITTAESSCTSSKDCDPMILETEAVSNGVTEPTAPMVLTEATGSTTSITEPVNNKDQNTTTNTTKASKKPLTCPVTPNVLKRSNKPRVRVHGTPLVLKRSRHVPRCPFITCLSLSFIFTNRAKKESNANATKRRKMAGTKPVVASIVPVTAPSETSDQVHTVASTDETMELDPTSNHPRSSFYFYFYFYFNFNFNFLIF
jgi:hypothetical protein